MKKTILDGNDFFKLFSYGASEVISNRDKLNKINVFPVADGDTGNNLVFTLNSVLDYAQVKDSVYETLKSMAEASLSGARGNSGVIFAQYIAGLASETKGKASIMLHDFANASKNSAYGLYNALSNPVEGTMLTVIKDWSNYIVDNHKNYDSFDDLFEESVGYASKSLDNTKEQLEILKKNDVVDSGAKGFVLFLEGALRYLRGEVLPEIKRFSLSDLSSSHDSLTHEESSYRYCTECILKGNLPSTDVVKETLIAYGDSLIVAGNEDFKHVHIHTDRVSDFFKAISKLGNISRPKVDDIFIQEKLNDKKGTTAIVTDSIGDIPKNLIDKYMIHQIPLNITVGEDSYLDKVSISSEDFYEYMKSSPIYPNSSLPNEIQIKEKLEFLSQNYENIIIINVSSKLSGTHSAMVKASKELSDSGYPIKVIDSKVNSAAQGLLVLHAAKMADSGSTMEEITDYLNDKIPKSEIYVALNTFRNALNSGRLPKIVGKIGIFFRLRPIISIDREGNGSAFSVAFSKTTLINKILKLVNQKNQQSKISSYCIVHSGDLDTANSFAKEVTNILGYEPEYICEISSVTALHAGEKAVAIGFIR